MKIWEVTENDNQIRFYFFAKKSEAQIHAKQYKKDVPDGNVKISAIEFQNGRDGMAKALNWLINMTCFNE